MIEQAVPLQVDLFTGDLVDLRTREHRWADRERQQPQQTALFSQREVAQFGVRANPVMPFSPGKLKLISEDSPNRGRNRPRSYSGSATADHPII